MTYILAKAMTEHNDGFDHADPTSASSCAMQFSQSGVNYKAPTSAIYVGDTTTTGADASLVLFGDAIGSTAIVFKNMIAGTIYPFALNKIHTDSTVASIVGLSDGRDPGRAY